jgi:glycosyltransferase involved in cell wall biosynthesis
VSSKRGFPKLDSVNICIKLAVMVLNNFYCQRNNSKFFMRTHLNSPLVSIITVVRNEATGIVQTLESLQQPTYPHIEHIIIDAKSTDGTSELIAQYKHPGAFHLRESDRGTYDGMNKGWRCATGEIVGFLNGGEVFAYPEGLAELVEVFNQYFGQFCQRLKK